MKHFLFLALLLLNAVNVFSLKLKGQVELGPTNSVQPIGKFTYAVGTGSFEFELLNKDTRFPDGLKVVMWMDTEFAKLDPEANCWNQVKKARLDKKMGKTKKLSVPMHQENRPHVWFLGVSACGIREQFTLDYRAVFKNPGDSHFSFEEYRFSTLSFVLSAVSMFLAFTFIGIALLPKSIKPFLSLLSALPPLRPLVRAMVDPEDIASQQAARRGKRRGFHPQLFTLGVVWMSFAFSMLFYAADIYIFRTTGRSSTVVGFLSGLFDVIAHTAICMLILLIPLKEKLTSKEAKTTTTFLFLGLLTLSIVFEVTSSFYSSSLFQNHRFDSTYGYLLVFLELMLCLTFLFLIPRHFYVNEVFFLFTVFASLYLLNNCLCLLAAQFFPPYYTHYILEIGDKAVKLFLFFAVSLFLLTKRLFHQLGSIASQLPLSHQDLV